MKKMKFKILLLLAALLSFTNALTAEKYYLSACAIFQNEAPYLKEWIEFHKLVGVEHFYLYNNLSTDNYKKILKPYIKSGEVEVFDWNYNTNADGGNWPTIQGLANNHALERAQKSSKWLAVIDTDEFLFPVEKNNLAEFLKDYEDCAAVSVNWQMYGTSNVEKVPKNKLMIECLIRKAPTHYGDNIHVKTIVQPNCAESFWSAHFPDLKNGHTQFNADKVGFKGPYSPGILVDKIRINHYWTGDIFYLNHHKLPRRKKWQVDPNYILKIAEEINQVEDKAIFKYVPELRKRLKK